MAPAAAGRTFELIAQGFLDGPVRHVTFLRCDSSTYVCDTVVAILEAVQLIQACQAHM